MSYFVSFTLSHPRCCSLKITNYGIRQKEIFLHVWLLLNITFYQRRYKNRIFKHNFIFRYTWIYKQSILTMQWNYFFVCKYYIVISDTLIGARMCFSVQSNFIEIALRHGWSPVNLPHIFRIHFPKSSFGRLFLLLLSVILLELQDKPSRKD